MKKILLLCFLAIINNSFAQRIFLDQSFGDSGFVTCKTNSYLFKIVSLPDGKVLCFGTYPNNKGVDQPTIFKYDFNGNLDTTFNKDGILQDTIVKTTYPPSNFMNVQPDGRIFMVSFPYISCYDSNGNPILTFGKFGVLKLETFENILSGNLIGFSSCPDNKTIVCWLGYSNLEGTKNYGHIIEKFDSTGTIDRSFGTNGFLFFKYSSMKFLVDAITVLKDNNIICAGSDKNEIHDLKINERTTIIKLNSNGTFNNNFGTNGKVIIDVDSNYIPKIDIGLPCLETARNISNRKNKMSNFILVSYEKNFTEALLSVF